MLIALIIFNILLEIDNGFELLKAYSDLQEQFVSFVMSQSQYHDTESKQVNAIMEGTAGSWKSHKPALAQVLIQHNIFF
jgi:hypothetical protein